MRQREQKFRDYIILHNLPWMSREEIEPDITSPLNEHERKLFEKWKCEFNFESKENYTLDFMVQVLGIDLIHTVNELFYIETTSSYPYTRYFEYLERGFEVQPIKPMRYNEESFSFEPFDRGTSHDLLNQELEYVDIILDKKVKRLIKR